MINPNELMIGNWFHPTRMVNGIRIPIKDKFHRVTAFDDWGEIKERLPTRVDTLVFSHQEIEPIPLDPTILEKCGFVLNGFKQYEMEIKGQSCAKRTLEFAGDYLYLREIPNPKNRFDDGIITLWNKDLMKTFYLHSLQNLVFSLTGSPLKIEL